MIAISDVILISLFIEAIVNALKPIWTPGAQKMTVSEYVSMGLGVLLAVSCKIDMLAYVVAFSDYPLWVEYVFYVLTGIAIGRGTNFLYDLWEKLKEWQGGQIIKEGIAAKYANEIDSEITNWSLSELKGFCEYNDVDVTGCQTREDYIDAIERAFPDDENAKPPVSEGVAL